VASQTTPGVDIAKSTRHSQITGDFAEALVLYWLSRDKFECARVNHTGIDLLARNRHTGELMGISVKSRSRFRGTETESLSVSTEEFKKVERACEAFGCQPYFAIVVDGGGWLRMFLTSMSHFRKVAKSGQERVHWGMTKKHIERYRADAQIRSVELQISAVSWWGTPHNSRVQGDAPQAARA
jgi:Holliday junction resolvase-like predicted endonuclease